MQNNKFLIASLSILLISFLSGCADKDPKLVQPQMTENVKMEFYEPSKFRLKPIIGSRNNDARTVVDMGTLLKIWVAPYKSRNGVLTASHDIYAWARMPDFIVGEEVPTISSSVDKGSGLIFNNKLPATFSSQEVDRGNLQDDKNIQEFVNGLNKVITQELEKSDKPISENDQQNSVTKKADQNILNFIKK